MRTMQQAILLGSVLDILLDVVLAGVLDAGLDGRVGRPKLRYAGGLSLLERLPLEGGLPRLERLLQRRALERGLYIVHMAGDALSQEGGQHGHTYRSKDLARDIHQ